MSCHRWTRLWRYVIVVINYNNKTQVVKKQKNFSLKKFSLNDKIIQNTPLVVQWLTVCCPMISQKKQIILLGWTSRSRWNQREIFIFMVFSSQHKSLAQKIKFVADDLWNDNRRLERLLKTEAGASSVALGKAIPCACVCWSVCVFHIVLIFSVGIRVTTVAIIFYFKYAGQICCKTQTVFYQCSDASVSMKMNRTSTLVGLWFARWCVGWDPDVWVETVMCGVKDCLKYGSMSVTDFEKGLFVPTFTL